MLFLSILVIGVFGITGMNVFVGLCVYTVKYDAVSCGYRPPTPPPPPPPRARV